MADARFFIRCGNNVSDVTLQRIRDYIKELKAGDQHKVLILEADQAASIAIVPFTDEAAKNYQNWLCGLIENDEDHVTLFSFEGNVETMKVGE
ncbi:MAG: hypothetical protein A2Y38_17365 [Spirochaetes bacterium GWB1_59_5]|nr:MAG: hypothetical protein A2Y38_17365 [Spirochaetes bacterium GWB1_59_5]